MKKIYKPNFKNKLTLVLRVLFFILFLISAMGTRAQIQVTGHVTDSTGYSLAGATVTVKGSAKGTVTDNDGKFTLSVPDQNSVLVISYLGYTTLETMIGTTTNMNISLGSDAQLIEETVVTALNMKHSQKTLGYSVTKVDGSSLTGSREVNVMNSLEGKVAGVNVSGVSSGPSGSANVLIRGSNSISGVNQPLYVIDGIPIDNSNLGNAGEWGGYDAGDGISSINPDDIAEMTVLKGAAASALYGSRAASGVIIITTKRGISRKGMGVEFNSNYTLDEALDYKDFQDQYGQGSLGLKPASQAEALNAGYSSWGGLLDGSSVPQFDGVSRPYSYVSDNFHNFYQTGSTFTNTLSLTGGNDDAAVRFSVSHLDNSPVIRNSSFDRTSFSLTGDARLGKHLTAGFTARYVIENSKNRSNLSDGPGNPNAGIASMPTSYSVKDIENNYVDSNGNEIPVGDVFVTNPYFAIYKFENDVGRNRVLASGELKYQITSFLYAKGRVTNDWYNTSIVAITPSGTAYQPQGSMTKDLRNVSDVNYEGIIGFTKELASTLSLDAFVGANREDFSFKQNMLGGSTFSIFGLYTEANLLNKTASDNVSKSRVNSIFGSAELGFNNYLYLTLTGRNEYFSTLSLNDNQIFYPSAGLSFIFSDAFKMPTWFTFGKVRASYAKVGGGAPAPYLLSLTYGLDGSHNGQPLGQINESTLPNPDLKPRQIQELEAGFDIRFFQDRLGIDFAVYDKKTTDDIVQAAVSEASGYSNVYLNIGEVTNKGVELMLNVTPVKTDKFRWDASINLSNNTNEVVNLTGDTAVQSLELGGSRVQTTAVYAVVGLPTSQIGGSGFLTNSDGQIVNSNGLPLATPKVQYFGTGIAPFQAGFGSSFKFNRFTLNFLIDMKSGAKIYSGSNAEAASAGLTTETLDGRGGDNNYVAPGVDQATGQANSTSVKPWDYWGTVVSTVTEPFVYSANFGKLRQVGISYDLPGTLIPNTSFQGATISFVVRNVAMLWNDAPNIDPESNYNIGTDAVSGKNIGQGLELWGLPSTRSYQLNLNFRF